MKLWDASRPSVRVYILQLLKALKEMCPILGCANVCTKHCRFDIFSRRLLDQRELVFSYNNLCELHYQRLLRAHKKRIPAMKLQEYIWTKKELQANYSRHNFLQHYEPNLVPIPSPQPSLDSAPSQVNAQISSLISPSAPFDAFSLHLYDFDEIHNVDIYAVTRKITTNPPLFSQSSDDLVLPVQYFFRVLSGYIPFTANPDNIYEPPVIKVWHGGNVIPDDRARTLTTVLQNRRKCIAPINKGMRKRKISKSKSRKLFDIPTVPNYWHSQ